MIDIAFLNDNDVIILLENAENMLFVTKATLYFQCRLLYISHPIRSTQICRRYKILHILPSFALNCWL